MCEKTQHRVREKAWREFIVVVVVVVVVVLVVLVVVVVEEAVVIIIIQRGLGQTDALVRHQHLHAVNLRTTTSHKCAAVPRRARS